MKLQVDLRPVPATEFVGAMDKLPSGVSLLITAWQWTLLKKSDNQRARQATGRITVMVPDFLQYARLASTGQAAQILRLPASMGNVMTAGLACVPDGVALLPSLATGKFWAAAQAMTAYDLGLLGRDFSGEVALHYNLTDFACFFDKAVFLQTFQKKCLRARSWGFATQQVSALLSLCSRHEIIPSRLMFPTGMSRPETQVLEAARSHQFKDTRSTIDFTQWPHQILESADLYEFARPDDDTWLVSLETALRLC